MQYVCGRMSRAALYKEPGSRLVAAAPCLGRHAHPAGRSPNNSSLFLPLAAVVAVAVRIRPLYGVQPCYKTKTSAYLHTLRFFGGRGWTSRAAHLKKPRSGFFPRRTIRRVLRVALAAFSAAPWQGFEKAERCPSLASLFPPQAAVGSAAVRIHPCIPFFKADKTETPVPIGYRSSWWARVDSNHRS